MKPDTVHLGLITSSLLMLVVALWQERGEPESSVARKPARPNAVALVLEAIPRDAQFVATLNLETESAPALRALLFDTGQELGGLGSLREVCGYDPGPLIRALALAAFAPEASGNREPAFGIVASGHFDERKLADCAERLVEARGGTPERRRVSGLTLVRDQRKPSTAVALLDNGLVLVSQEPHLRQMLRALDGQIERISHNATHRSLRKALGDEAALLATLELEAGWLGRLFENENVQRSPLVALTAAGLAADLEQSLTLRALLRCRNEDGCREVRGFLVRLEQSLRPAFEQQLGGEALEKAELSLEGSELRARLVLETDTLKRLAHQLSSAPLPLTRPTPEKPAPSSAPEETIPAKP